jgi:hypothetical protein
MQNGCFTMAMSDYCLLPVFNEEKVGLGTASKAVPTRTRIELL